MKAMKQTLTKVFYQKHKGKIHGEVVCDLSGLSDSQLDALVSAVHHELTDRRATRNERVVTRKCVKPQLMNDPIRKSPAIIETVCFAIVGSANAYHTGGTPSAAEMPYIGLVERSRNE